MHKCPSVLLHLHPPALRQACSHSGATKGDAATSGGGWRLSLEAARHRRFVRDPMAWASLRRNSARAMTPPPIFIVGAPRSGTSLLRQMLNRHPAIAICDETHFFRLIYQKRGRKAFGDLNDPANRRRLALDYLSLPPTRKLGLDQAKLAERLTAEAVSYPAMFASILSFYAESEGKQRVGEKTPNHALAAETLCEWFPGAVVLHLVRDPRDVAASLMRMRFGSSSAVLNARTWVRLNLAARRSSHRREYLEVRYENLVKQPELELTRICQFAGEDYSPRMLQAEQSSTQLPNEKDRHLTPLTEARQGRWRQELSPRQVAQIEWAVGPQLERFGYERETGKAALTVVLPGLGNAAMASVGRKISQLPALRVSVPKQIGNFGYLLRRRTVLSLRASRSGSR